MRTPFFDNRSTSPPSIPESSSGSSTSRRVMPRDVPTVRGSSCRAGSGARSIERKRWSWRGSIPLPSDATDPPTATHSQHSPPTRDSALVPPPPVSFRGGLSKKRRAPAKNREKEKNDRKCCKVFSHLQKMLWGAVVVVGEGNEIGRKGQKIGEVWWPHRCAREARGSSRRCRPRSSSAAWTPCHRPGGPSRTLPHRERTWTRNMAACSSPGLRPRVVMKRR